ncbi:MAG: type II toxin-antitoxin system YafQ family toxin [bacterium]
MKIVYSSQFKKDYKKVKKQNKNLEKLSTVIDKLAAKERLDAKYRDHPLSGSWKGFRDCHLEPDWILIYQTTEEALILARMGLHVELFKN